MSDKICQGPDCYKPITGKRSKRFCSDACRAGFWRQTKVPRCPNCGYCIEITVVPFKRQAADG